MTELFGWAITFIGVAITLGGLVGSARAMLIAHDASIGGARPWVATRSARFVRWLLRRPPKPITGTLHGITGTVSISSALSAFATVRRPINEDDDTETMVAKLVYNFEQLESTIDGQAKMQNDRAAKIENTVATHREAVVALEDKLSAAESREQARMANALPNEALGLVAAGAGQVVAFLGTILLAI